MSSTEDLREAYLEFGCAITSLKGMQLHSGGTSIDVNAVNSAHGHADVGNHLAGAAGDVLGFPWKPAVFRVDTGIQRVVADISDAALAPVSDSAAEQVDRVIEMLWDVRRRLGAEMESRNIGVPDDLPDDASLESGFGTGRSRWVLHASLTALILGGLVYGLLFG